MEFATLGSMVPARDRCLPVDEALAAWLPDAGLRRGWAVGCSGPASVSMALALAARAVSTGSWLAVAGVPLLGAEATAEAGIPLSRLVAVDTGGRPALWAERVAAAVDGFDLVLTRPPVGADRVARRVRQRLQARGAVLLAVGPSSPGISCDLELVTGAAEWVGLGAGHGHLRGRRVTVAIGGRRMPRPVEIDLWLPGPDGRIAPVSAEASAADRWERAG